MRAHLRPARETDFAWCASILEDGFEAHPQLRAQMPGVWRELIRTDAMVMWVLVDADRADHPVAFGATVFVSDAFAEGVLKKLRPYVALRALEREVTGRSRVILRPSGIRKQSLHGDGLNLVILHYSEVTEEYDEEDRYIVRDMMVQGLLETHSRYRLKRLLYELFGEADVDYVRESGAPLITDYQEWFLRQKVALPVAQKRPFLFAVDQVSARQRRAAWMSWLFLSKRGRAGLSPAEQRILTRALAGETDQELTHQPEIDSSTVRKHWRSIYRKFKSAGIQLLPSADQGARKKRPFLLNYVRQHPEELRPPLGERKGAGEGE